MSATFNASIERAWKIRRLVRAAIQAEWPADRPAPQTAPEPGHPLHPVLALLAAAELSRPIAENLRFAGRCEVAGDLERHIESASQACQELYNALLQGDGIKSARLSVDVDSGDLVDYLLRLAAAFMDNGRDAGNPSPMPPENAASPEARALSILMEHEDWSNDRIAQAVGVHPKTLSRKGWSTFRAARQVIRRRKADLPKGSKSSDGDLDAWE